MPFRYSIVDNQLNFYNYYDRTINAVPAISFNTGGIAAQEIQNYVYRFDDYCNNALTQTRINGLKYNSVWGTAEEQPAADPTLKLFVTDKIIQEFISCLPNYNPAGYTRAANDYRLLRDYPNDTIANLYADASKEQLRHTWAIEFKAALKRFAKGEIDAVYMGWSSANADNMMYAFHESGVGRAKVKPTPKETQLMYKHLGAKKAHVVTPDGFDAGTQIVLENCLYDIGEWRAHLQYKECHLIKLVKLNPVPVVATPTKQVEVTLSKLMPNLRRDVISAKDYFSSYMGRWRSPIDFKHDTLVKAFDAWNNIKFTLMLNGWDEQRATKFVTRIVLGNKYKTLVTCSVTKQLLPKIFTGVLRTGEPISLRYILLSNQNAGGYNVTTKYQSYTDANEETGQLVYGYVEAKIDKDKVFYTDVFNYTLRTPSILSPRSVAGEYVSTIGKGCKYSPTPWLGVELEVERKDSTKGDGKTTCAPDITSLVYDALGRDFVMFKTDGSLRGHQPFEIVTTPATLAYHKQRWESFMNNIELKGNLQSFSSGNCGMHVHISRDAFTGLHLAKFMRFINMSDNNQFIVKVAQRAGNRYSAYENYGTITSAVRKLHQGERGAVNTNNKGTIEVRIFRGNLSKTAFFKNLEFVHAAWAFTKDCSLSNLNYKDFLYWLYDTKNDHSKQYANLMLWLVAQGFNVSNVVIPKETPADKKIKLVAKRDDIKKIQGAITRKYSPEETTLKRGKGLVTKTLLVNNI